ncbi:unnamed protein product [Rotaria sordida]|uniref:Uncharacterized protein n=1 Tax=Rotaria sordida TaxID=392033 RepID=A0A813XH94_9BILA|nr:unnamed protein product [Rotaria sordida]CAF0825513.1 unnamed protein product [Rotaria sordida]CAF0864814.1 unnamed protein product [Rotaria sordida]
MSNTDRVLCFIDLHHNVYVNVSSSPMKQRKLAFTVTTLVLYHVDEQLSFVEMSAIICRQNESQLEKCSFYIFLFFFYLALIITQERKN